MTDQRPSLDADALDADIVLGHLQEFARVGFWDLDIATERLYLSTQVFEILGLETPSIAAYLECVHPDDLELVQQVYVRARSQPGPYRLRHRTRDGERLVQLRMQSVVDGTGQPVRIMGVISDVTAEWQLERELDDSASARLTGLLAGGAVHDLKNIFAVLLGHAQLALAADDREQRPNRESLEALQRAATNGIELTQQLLQVGRSEPLQTRRVGVEDLFRRLGATARTALGRQHRVEVDPGPGGIDVLADEARLERAVVDLLINAKDALSPAGGSVCLSFRPVEVVDGTPRHVGHELAPGTYGVVEVRDDGVGMTNEVLARVTDPFFTTKGRDHGSGVGLHTVARFVEATGGALHIESEPGRGTIVQLVLPARVRDRPPAPRRRSVPVRVLLQGVDDDRFELIATVLRGAGMQCVATSSMVGAGNVLRTEPIDLLVVDRTDGDSGEEASLLRVAASTSTPVLGLADVVDPAGADGPHESTWLDALVSSIDDVVGRSPQRVRS